MIKLRILLVNLFLSSLLFSNVTSILAASTPGPGSSITPSDEKGFINTAIGRVPTDPTALVNTIFRFALGIAGGVAFLLIVYGGFKLAFSGGNPENIQSGREVITSAIVGLLIVIFSTFILQLIGINILGLPIG